MMVDDSNGTKTYSITELNEVKMRVNELASEIEVAKERLEIVKNGKPGKLEAIINDVKVGWEREVAELSADIQNVFSAAREQRAKLTLEIQKANQKYLKAKRLLSSLNEAERAIGGSQANITKRLGVPERPFIEENIGSFPAVWKITDKGVLPSEDELERAYKTGEIPRWIEHYKQFGELLTDDELVGIGEESSKTKGFLIGLCPIASISVNYISK